MTPTAVTSPAASVVPLSATEFIQRHGAADHVELVQGVVQEVPVATQKHGKICARMVRFLNEHAEKHDLGHVNSNDSFVQTQRDPDSVRGADVCFFSYERLPRGEIPEGLLAVVPDLVVEVRSPTDRWTEVFAKVVEYLQAGVRVTILLDAPSCTASVYRADELQQIFHNGDELVVADVLPGFAVPVRRLFE